MYTKSHDPEQQIKDWEWVMTSTKGETSIVAHYAFHGVRSEARAALTFLKNSPKTEDRKDDWIARLEVLSAMVQS